MGLVDLGGHLGRHDGAVAQHGDPLADVEHLAEVVRDVDQGDTLAMNHAQHLEESVDLRSRQRRRGLVEHEDACLLLPTLERPRDGDTGALGGRERCHGHGDVEVVTQGPEELARRARLPAPRDRAARALEVAPAEGQVVQRAEGRRQAEVLVYEAQAGLERGGGVAEAERVPVDGRLRTGVGVVIPGEDLDEGRLARAVLADEGMDLVGFQLEVDAVESLLARKRLREPVDPEHGRVSHRRASPPRLPMIATL